MSVPVNTRLYPETKYNFCIAHLSEYIAEAWMQDRFTRDLIRIRDINVVVLYQ